MSKHALFAGLLGLISVGLGCQTPPTKVVVGQRYMPNAMDEPAEISNEVKLSYSVQRRLESTIISVDFNASPLADALESIQEQIEIPVVADWVVLRGVGIERDMPIDLAVSNEPAETVLRLVSLQAGGT